MKQSLTFKKQANKYYPHKELRKFWRIVFIVIIGMLFYFHSMAQVKDSLIADETHYTELKASVKIETSNETIFGQLKQLNWNNYTVSKKHDRNGEYIQYSVYFKKENIDIIRKWIAKL